MSLIGSGHDLWDLKSSFRISSIVCSAEESLQGPRVGRIELPHMESTALAGENLAKKHHLDHIGRTDVLLYHAHDALLQRHHLVGRCPVQALVGPGCQPQWRPGLGLGSGGPCGVTGFRDIEPLLQLSLHGLQEGALGPSDVGELAHHGTAALRVLTIDHFELHIEDLEP